MDKKSSTNFLRTRKIRPNLIGKIGSSIIQAWDCYPEVKDATKARGSVFAMRGGCRGCVSWDYGSTCRYSPSTIRFTVAAQISKQSGPLIIV